MSHYIGDELKRELLDAALDGDVESVEYMVGRLDTQSREALALAGSLLEKESRRARIDSKPLQ